MPLFTAVLVVVFGGLTLYLKNDVFIKMKPTVLYGFFGAVLLGGLAFNRLFIKYVFAQAFELDELGWRKLTVRWGLFFLGLAVLNETVWRCTSTATWVSFKVWGIIPLIFLFALAQTPLVIKHQVPKPAPDTRKNDAPAASCRTRAISLKSLEASRRMVRKASAYKALCRGRAQSRGSRSNASDGAWITAGAFCKDEMVKICAWTSVRKTVLTSASGARPFLKPEYGA